MPLRLIPPGTRKGNPFYLVRGSVAGRSFEISAKTRDKAAARQFAKDLERELAQRRVPRPGEAVTFAAAADLYLAWRDPAKPDRQRIARLKVTLGKQLVADIRQADLVAAADLLQPEKAAATRNREVLRPAAAILHYASENGFCDWLRAKLFKEPAPATRAVSVETATELIGAAEGRIGYIDRRGKRRYVALGAVHRLLLLWLFHHGTRISQTLAVRWADIDLPAQTFRLYDKKTQAWQTFPLHPEVFEELAAIAIEARTGRLWPWTQKTGVYRWLRPLTRERLGVHFTPHMGRHSRGTWLNASGAGLRTIMAALGHKDPKSSIRYQAADVEIVRAASGKLGDLLGKAPTDRRNAG